MGSSYDHEQRDRSIRLGVDLEFGLVALIRSPDFIQAKRLARVLGRGRARSRKLQALFLSPDLEERNADRVWDDAMRLDTKLDMVRSVARKIPLTTPPKGRVRR